MHRQLIRYISAIIVCLTWFAVRSEAQFKEEAFTQTYNEEGEGASADTAATFSFKEYFGGLGHKNDLKI